MRIHTKIHILLISTIIVFAIAVSGYFLIKHQQEKLFLRANIDAKTQIIDNILSNKSESFLAPVNDYSCWDEMVNYVKKPSKQWEKINLTTILSAFEVSNAWIYNKDLTLVFSTFDSSLYKSNFLIDNNIISEVFADTAYCHFFLFTNNQLVEITGSTIVSSDDNKHTSNPNGYFLVAKLWNDEYIGILESAMGFKIHLNYSIDSVNTENSVESENIKITKSIDNHINKKIATLEFSSYNQLAHELANTNKFSYIIGFLLVITFVVFILTIQNWISNPLKNITKSLTLDDITPIEKLENRKDEFGEITSLIKTFFDQKIQLEIEIAERAEAQQMVNEMYNETVNLNHELQASEEELRQNLDMIMELNEMLSKQQKEITDSINYASHIQAASLPPESSISCFNKDFFIMFKPRNIVSGDFYWVTRRENKLIVAIADCTGHGVPGGFMSMLGMAYLNEIVNQCASNTPADILDALRKKVIESLHQTGKSGESKDGMDISFIIIDFDTMKLQFSGAYNPLYIARKSEESESPNGYGLIEYKGDRMPIGYSLRSDRPFTNIEINIGPDDTIYMFTDGYQDQISGITRKKFNRTKMKNLLIELQSYPILEQKNILELAFDAYRAEYPQVDDILVFGMKI